MSFAPETLAQLEGVIARVFDIKFAEFKSQLVDNLCDKIVPLIMLKNGTEQISLAQKGPKATAAGTSNNYVIQCSISMSKVKTTKDFIGGIVKQGAGESGIGAAFYNSILVTLGVDKNTQYLTQLQQASAADKSKSTQRLTKFNLVYDTVVAPNADAKKEMDLVFEQYKKNIEAQNFIIPPLFYIGCNAKMMEQFEEQKKAGATFKMNPDQWETPNAVDDDEPAVSEPVVSTNNALGLPVSMGAPPTMLTSFGFPGAPVQQPQMPIQQPQMPVQQPQPTFPINQIQQPPIQLPLQQSQPQMSFPQPQFMQPQFSMPMAQPPMPVAPVQTETIQPPIQQTSMPFNPMLPNSQMFGQTPFNPSMLAPNIPIQTPNIPMPTPNISIPTPTPNNHIPTPNNSLSGLNNPMFPGSNPMLPFPGQMPMNFGQPAPSQQPPIMNQQPPIMNQQSPPIMNQQSPPIMNQPTPANFAQPGMNFVQPGMNFGQPGMNFAQPGMNFGQPGITFPGGSPPISNLLNQAVQQGIMPNANK